MENITKTPVTLLEERVDTLEKLNKDLENLLNRLQVVGHKLCDDSSQKEVSGKIGECKEPFPGHINDLKNLLENYDAMLTGLAREINKLETLI